MSYEPDRYVVDDRRIGTSYLLAAIVLGVVFVQCFPNSAAGDRVAQEAAVPIIVGTPDRVNLSEDATVNASLVADDDLSGSGTSTNSMGFAPGRPSLWLSDRSDRAFMSGAHRGKQSLALIPRPATA